jgi:hypothetical protein
MDLSVMIPRKYYQMGNLHFEYIREDKYMYLHETKGENTRFLYKTPMLKVFKNIHEFNNDYYLILNLDNEDDINHEIYNFKSRMDRIYGKAQDEVKKNYKEIFPNLKGYVDQVTYETCVKRPYTGSRGQLMKILIEEGNQEMFHKLERLIEGDHMQCTIWYKGLRKVSGGKMIEEYILIDFVTEDQWMSEITKKMIHPYGTKYEVEVVKEEEEKSNTIESTDLHETFENTNSITPLPTNEEENNEDDMEVISLKEEPICEIKEDVEEPIIEEMKKSRKTRKSKNVETPKSSRKKREEWVKSKRGEYQSDPELSDQEEFQELSQEEKEKFRKLYKQMKNKS